MAASKGENRKRTSLLAGTSLVTATIIAAASGLALAPTPARADYECGDPATNGATADTFVCTDAAPYSQITYPTTSGNLTLQFVDDVTVTTGGVSVTPTGANTVTINRLGSAAGGGLPKITSTVDEGIRIVRAAGNNGNISVDLGDNDLLDSPLLITGTTAGVYISNAGTGTTALSTGQGTVTATNGVGVRLGTVGTGAITFNNVATVSGTTGAVLIEGGNAATVRNFGTFLGSVNFNNTGTSRLENGGVWQAGGVMFMGSGTSTLTNGGTIVVDGTLTFSSLETFNNGLASFFGESPTIVFGVGSDSTVTDGQTDDRLVLGANYNAGRPAWLEMDVLVGGADQTTCLAAVSADCLDMRGFSVTATSSVTSLVLNPVIGTQGLFADRIVLVDAAGGTLPLNTFMIDASTPGYLLGEDGLTGFEAGAMVYTLHTDTDGDQVYLSASLGSAPLRYLQFVDAAEAAADLTTSTWFDRQVEVRDGDRLGGGLWIRATKGYLERRSEMASGGFSFDTGFDQDTEALSVGGDVAIPFRGGALVVGLTASQIESEIETTAAQLVNMEGNSFGAYASWFAGPLYVDGIASRADLDTTSSMLVEDSEASVTSALVEAGYSIPVNDGLITIQPLAAIGYSTLELGEANIAGAAVSVEEASGFKAGLGIRVFANPEFAGLRTRLGFTGRLWQQFDSGIEARAGGETLTFDDNRDQLGDIAFTAAVFGLADRLSLQATARMKFQDAYEAGEVALGARFAF